MIRVAMDTATMVGSVALGEGGRVLAEAELGIQSRHAETLVPALDDLLLRAGVARAGIGAVVVGAGPGSFTGVRVAAATAKGLCAGLDVPLLAYSSLLALAAGVARSTGYVGSVGGPSGRPVCGLFDARRGEAYGGCWWVGEAELVTVMEPTVGLAEALALSATAAALAAVPGAAPLFVGDGALRNRAALEAVGAEVSEGVDHPHARDLLWLAEHHPYLGRVADASAWQPLYVRGSSASP
jgi:tRNA threonylcarbamoyladenosine biosynthesis protein TsaB